MEPLAPRALYEHDDLGITQRLPWICGIFFGSAMGLFTLVDRLSGRGSVAGAFGYALAVAVFGGAAYGLMFPWLLVRVARRMNDRIHAGDPRLVPPPPPGRYLYRLPCGYLRRPNLAVGGVLYLGPGGLRFDPHLRNAARFREAVVMEPLQEVQLDLVDSPLPRWLWMWTAGRRTVQRIRVRWGGGEALFGIPGAAGVLETLQQRVAALKKNPSSSGCSSPGSAR
jgi:hypothetical protein